MLTGNVVLPHRAPASRLPFDGTPATYFYGKNLFADIVIFVSFVGAFVWALYRLVPKTLSPSFSLRSLFILLLVAGLVAFELPYLRSRVMQYRVEMVILGAAGATTVFAIAGLVAEQLKRRLVTDSN